MCDINLTNFSKILGLSMLNAIINRINTGVKYIKNSSNYMRVGAEHAARFVSDTALCALTLSPVYHDTPTKFLNKVAVLTPLSYGASQLANSLDKQKNGSNWQSLAKKVCRIVSTTALLTITYSIGSASVLRETELRTYERISIGDVLAYWAKRGDDLATAEYYEDPMEHSENLALFALSLYPIAQIASYCLSIQTKSTALQKVRKSREESVCSDSD